MRSSVASILHNQEDNGAFVASPDFAEYRYCWLRDGSFIAYALDQVGEHHASSSISRVGQSGGREHQRSNRPCDRLAREASALHPDHMPPARFALDGSNVADDWPNFQIDGYGTWLWALGQHLAQHRPGRGSKGIPSFRREGRTLSRRVCPQSLFRRLGRERACTAYFHAGVRLWRADSRCAICWTTRTCLSADSVQSRVREERCPPWTLCEVERE